ncbi:MAG: hypothetical protein KAT37_04775 [Candidatus Aenigmarchaeota archaeon]|nr:hypothetical protein [Candidatus Aenigmarchaeota archaeon]
MELSKDIIEDSELQIWDYDGVIGEVRIANCLFGIIMEEKKRGNKKNYRRGIRGGLKVMAGTKIMSPFSQMYAENWGLKKAIEIVGNTDPEIGKERIQEAALQRHENYKLSGVEAVIETLREDYGLDFYISSTSADIFIEPVAKKLGAVGFTTQEVFYEGENPKGVKLRVRNKYEVTKNDLEEKGYSVKNSVYFGDGPSDLEFKGNSKLFFASPLAKPPVRRVADFQIDDYRNFNRELKEL